jgi:hypothetical protein
MTDVWIERRLGADHAIAPAEGSVDKALEGSLLSSDPRPERRALRAPPLTISGQRRNCSSSATRRDTTSGGFLLKRQPCA